MKTHLKYVIAVFATGFLGISTSAHSIPAPKRNFLQPVLDETPQMILVKGFCFDIPYNRLLAENSVDPQISAEIARRAEESIPMRFLKKEVLAMRFMERDKKSSYACLYYKAD